ncbi:hypothetical protein HY485_01040 [Candidatus Woesearchaeota archaeon]|nr:hypothetical protein [Candidatus Woesearchaeota archaeon]
MELENLNEADFGEEVHVDIKEEAFETARCTKCNRKMREIITDFELPGRELTLHISASKCQKCGKEMLNGRQAEKFQYMLLLIDAVKDNAKIKFERAMNYDGKSFFIRFPQELTAGWDKDMVTEIMPITNNELVIHVHKT